MQFYPKLESQGLILSFSSYTINSYESLGKLNNLVRNNRITLLWVPDRRQTSSQKDDIDAFPGPDPFCWHRDHVCSKVLRKKEADKSVTFWKSCPGLRQAFCCMQKNRNSLHQLTGFFTGDCKLRKHRMLLSLEINVSEILWGNSRAPSNKQWSLVSKKDQMSEGLLYVTTVHLPSLKLSLVLVFLKEIGLDSGWRDVSQFSVAPDGTAK